MVSLGGLIIDNIYLRTRDMKRQYFTIHSDIHSAPRLSTPLEGVDNHYTETVSVNIPEARLRELIFFLVLSFCVSVSL